MAPQAPTSPRRKRLTAEHRRAAIRDAALEVFARRGYHAASIDEIAHAAGISKALIYEHFPSKKDLHASLLERHAREIFDAFSLSVRASDTPEQRLRAGVDAFLGWAESHRDAFRLMFRDVFEADVAEMLTRIQAQATVAIAGLMSSEQDDDEDRLMIESYAQLLSGAVQSLAVWWQDHPEVARAFLVDRVMEFAWVGLERLARGRQ